MRSEASSLHASEPVVSTDHLSATGLGEAAVPSGRQPQSTEPLFPTRGRLLHATTDWRFLCRPISSIPAVRQLSAGKGVGRNSPSSGSPQGAEGGRWKTSTATAACIERARREGEGAASRVVRSYAQGKRPTRGGESARTRWSCGGSARPPNFQARRSHGRAHWQKETALWARWGAHRARVEADA